MSAGWIYSGLKYPCLPYSEGRKAYESLIMLSHASQKQASIFVRALVESLTISKQSDACRIMGRWETISASLRSYLQWPPRISLFPVKGLVDISKMTADSFDALHSKSVAFPPSPKQPGGHHGRVPHVPGDSRGSAAELVIVSCMQPLQPSLYGQCD